MRCRKSDSSFFESASLSGGFSAIFSPILGVATILLSPEIF
jgi:hypothetical protein